MEYEDVHKIGINYFIYQNESIPFTGCSVKRGSVAGAVVSKTCFRDGMIHHREIYEPDANAKVVEISFLNESVSKVAFWSPDGQFRESSAESVRINELIKELGYGHLYDDDPL